VVQPLLINGLLFALLLRSRSGQSVSRREIGWAVVVSLALVGFLVLANTAHQVSTDGADRGTAIAAAVAGIVLAVVCVANRSPQRWRLQGLLPCHSSYTAGAVWFDPHLLRATLHPGTAQPSGHGWGAAPTITQSSGLLAAFNSGFKLADAHGGFYENGRYAKALAPGGASMVFYTDGAMTVRQWGRDVHMGPDVAAVRQNLRLLVDHVTVVPGTNAHTQQVWGGTIGAKKNVGRSGIGVTANGNIVNVIGPRLSAHSLAVLLQRAGAVRVMQLDINPEWTSYVLYHQPSNTHPGATNLLPTMHRSPTRYNSVSARDFVTLHAR